jgi:hypothetical protein
MIQTHVTPGTEDREIDQRIELLSKPLDFAFLPEPKVTRDWSRDVDGQELSNHREDYNIVGEEWDVKPGLGVTCVSGFRIFYASRNKEQGCEWVADIEMRCHVGSDEFPVEVEDEWDQHNLEGSDYGRRRVRG